MARQLLVAQPCGCGTPLTGGTAISAEVGREGLRREAFVVVEVAPAGVGRTAALLLVVVLAVTTAVLPAAFALGMAGGVAGTLTAGLGGLAAVFGGVKLAAAAGGLASGLLERPRLRAVAAAID